MEPSTAPTHLFVYGTLRRSAAHPMHALVHPTTFVDKGTAPGRLYDVGNYPGMVVPPGVETRVQGEVYLLDDPDLTLANLDQYEACTDEDTLPHEYVRVVQTVSLQNGASVQAWTYLYNRPVDGLTPVPSGDWVLWRSQRPGSSPAGA